MVARLSLRARLVLGMLALAAVGLAAADVATYTSLRSFLFDRTDNTLNADHHFVEGAFSNQDDLRAAGAGLFIQIRDTSGHVLFTSNPPRFPGQKSLSPPKLPATIKLPPAPQAGDGPDRVRYFTANAVEESGRYRVRASQEPGSTAVLIVARSLRDVDSTLHRLLLIELLVTAGVAAAIVLLGLWIIRLGLRPLAAIGKTADAITAGDLSRRVERAESRTEVGRLGLALNAMLGRIEESDRRLRRFVADASHELRTPLAAVRAYAELFERGAHRRPDDLARCMSGIGRESERMSVIVEDLLLLARLDERRPLEREPVDVADVAREAVETARAVEPEREIELSVEPALVLGDRERLRRIVDNLLGNVRAHTPAGARAKVAVRNSDGMAHIVVEDSGPGVAADEIERVFERFFRADSSRARASGGVGLGLSIVAAVAEAHGGSASARSGPGGATFEIQIPLAEAP